MVAWGRRQRIIFWIIDTVVDVISVLALSLWHLSPCSPPKTLTFCLRAFLLARETFLAYGQGKPEMPELMPLERLSTSDGGGVGG